MLHKMSTSIVKVFWQLSTVDVESCGSVFLKLSTSVEVLRQLCAEDVGCCGSLLLRKFI